MESLGQTVIQQQLLPFHHAAASHKHAALAGEARIASVQDVYFIFIAVVSLALLLYTPLRLFQLRGTSLKTHANRRGAFKLVRVFFEQLGTALIFTVACLHSLMSSIGAFDLVGS